MLYVKSILLWIALALIAVGFSILAWKYLWIALALIAVVISSLVWNYLNRPDIPSLARDLPVEFELGEIEFQRRISATFPIGTKHEVVVQRLSEDGFSLGKPNSELECTACFSRPGFLYTFVWFIDWKLDENKRISDIWVVHGARGL